MTSMEHVHADFDNMCLFSFKMPKISLKIGINSNYKLRITHIKNQIKYHSIKPSMTRLLQAFSTSLI
jgi:hypothetical protein